jgi:hypothetical protein
MDRVAIRQETNEGGDRKDPDQHALISSRASDDAWFEAWKVARRERARIVAVVGGGR